MNETPVLDYVVYAAVWACIGGLPGFYLFASLRRNPRSGARLGVFVGLVVGFGGVFTGLIQNPADGASAAALVWSSALAVGLLANLLQVGMGTHNQTVTMRQRTADLAYGLLLPTFVIVFAIVVFPMLWNFILAFRPVRLRDLQELQLFALNDLTTANFNRILTMRGFTDTLIRTLIYTLLGTVLAILMGLVAALIVKDKFRGRNLVRGFMILRLSCRWC